VPGELLPRLGLDFKARMRAGGAGEAVIVGLANDELGYILAQEEFSEPADYAAPGDRYEESMSVGPEAGPILAASLERLLSDVRDRHR
jgi:hypothetical protein